MGTKQKNIKVVVRTKFGIMVQVWNHGCEYDELIKRVNLPESQLEWFTKKMAKFGYNVEVEEPALEDWRGYYYDLLGKRRKEIARFKYWQKIHPEEARSQEAILDFIMREIMLPKPIIVSKEKFNEIKAEFNKCEGKVIKFRRYKKDE